jgi:hypothetical protein
MISWLARRPDLSPEDLADFRELLPEARQQVATLMVPPLARLVERLRTGTFCILRPPCRGGVTTRRACQDAEWIGPGGADAGLRCTTIRENCGPRILSAAVEIGLLSVGKTTRYFPLVVWMA